FEREPTVAFEAADDLEALDRPEIVVIRNPGRVDHEHDAGVDGAEVDRHGPVVDGRARRGRRDALLTGEVGDAGGLTFGHVGGVGDIDDPLGDRRVARAVHRTTEVVEAGESGYTAPDCTGLSHVGLPHSTPANRLLCG